MGCPFLSWCLLLAPAWAGNPHPQLAMRADAWKTAPLFDQSRRLSIPVNEQCPSFEEKPVGAVEKLIIQHTQATVNIYIYIYLNDNNMRDRVTLSYLRTAYNTNCSLESMQALNCRVNSEWPLIYDLIYMECIN